MNKFIKRNTAIEGAVAYVVSIVFYLIVVVVLSVVVDGSEDDNTSLIASFAASTLISLGFFGSAFISNFGLGSHPYYEYKKTDRSFLFVCPLVFVIALIGFEGITLCYSYMLLNAGYSAGASMDFTGPLPIILNAVHVILIAPVCEEFLMRGTVLSSLVSGTDRINARWRMLLVIALDGLFFMLIHMNPYQTVYQILFGMLLSYITIKYGSIIPALMLHIINNVTGFILCIPAIDSAVTAFVYSSFSTVAGSILFVSESVILLALSIPLMIKIINKYAHGTLTESTMQSNNNNGYRAASDDNGSFIGFCLFIVGGVICGIIWIVKLLIGLA